MEFLLTFDNPNLEEQRWVVINDKNLYGSEREKNKSWGLKRETSPGGPGSGRVAMCRKAGLKGGKKEMEKMRIERQQTMQHTRKQHLVPYSHQKHFF